MNKKILFLLFISFVFCETVFGLSYGGCEYSTITRMRNLISNINISYDYHVVGDVAYFDVTLNNITPDIYFVDTNGLKKYSYTDTIDGEIIIKNYINSGSYKFYSNNSDCLDISLGTRHYSFPNYNPYYNSELCKGLENSNLCKKWVGFNYTKEQFENKISEYKKEQETTPDVVDDIEYSVGFFDKLVDLYVKYYYIFLGIIILLSIFGIYVNRTKNRFKL